MSAVSMLERDLAMLTRLLTMLLGLLDAPMTMRVQLTDAALSVKGGDAGGLELVVES